MSYDPWALLGLDRNAPARDVKRRYAQLLKAHRPGDDPDAFAQLRRAYEICLAHAPSLAAHEAPAAAGDAGAETANAGDPAVATEPATNAASAVAAESAGEKQPQQQAAPSARPPEAARTITLESLRLDRLDALRRPAVLVDELFARAQTTPDAFAAWLHACPELTNFAARDAVEIEFLVRFADRPPTLPAHAMNALDACFGWDRYDTPQRLVAGGLPHALLERVLPALEQALIDARFAAHVDGDTPLFKPGTGGALGNAARENALLRELHAARTRKPRWWHALMPTRIERTNHLLYAYAMRYGGAAAERLFGAAAIRFWQQANPGVVPNATRLTVLVMRGVLVLAAVAAMMGVAFALSPTPAALEELEKNLVAVASIAATYCIAVLIFGALRWTRIVGLRRLEEWHLRVLVAVEPWLAPARALPPLAAWNLPAIWLGIDHGIVWIVVAEALA
ncbi:MAG TPA: J domain-containing protein, partial [Tahibacter sp.]|nr:J domain-containing protein [Tahibacter sp.]